MKKFIVCSTTIGARTKKQTLKRLFCDETDLLNINYIQNGLLKKSKKTHRVIHVICVGRTEDFYNFFDSKTSRTIKTELHNHLGEVLSPSIIGLFEGKYIVIIFENNTPWKEKEIIKQQQIQRVLPQDKNQLFRRMAYSVKRSLQSTDGVYVYNIMIMKKALKLVQ